MLVNKSKELLDTSVLQSMTRVFFFQKSFEII